jgi:acyl-CoA synthetase (AMP-forming)/AMP-acid ligase II/acyl carrier protein
VSVEQRSVARLVKGANYARLGEKEVILQYAPVSFDAATFEIWGALCNGGRLVIAPADVTGLEELAEEIRREGVTVVWLTSALFQQMVERCLEGLRGVKQLLAGGDALPVAQVRKVVEELKGCRMINGYGPTENTTFTTTFEVKELREIEYGTPIGRPISNTQAYILDEDRRIAPVGVIGELYAGGEGLARGYLNRPELTAEKFIPNPFSKQPGERLYRTGDLCRYLPGGEIEFIGREDQQVKLRGYRIELGEIEKALAGHRRVKEAVVEARKDKSGEKRLVAYIVSDGAGIERGELRSYLAERLPEYMSPSAYVEMDELPVTANGKIDRKRLPEPEADESRYVEPASEVERAVAEIWAEALGLERVGVEDDFFELGGHSLMAARVISRVRDRFRVDVPLRDVYQRPTVANMARLIEAIYDGQQDEMNEMARMLDQLEGLAQEEVDALLHQMAGMG